MGLDVDQGGAFFSYLSSSGLASFFVVAILVITLVSFIAVKIVRNFLARNRYFSQTIFLVRLPKERPGEENKEKTVQELREEIAVGEAIFDSIGGSRAQRGLKAWFFGRDDNFSFEIVASNKKIYFYVVAPNYSARYIEQQIHARYPDALVEEVEDYNIFKPKARVFTAFLKTGRSFIFPLKTYNKMDIDPMSSIVNVMSKLEDEESMALQVVVRSSRKNWHRTISKVVKEVNSGKSASKAISSKTGGLMNRIFYFLSDLMNASKAKTDKEKNSRHNEPKKLSAMEEEMIKGMEEKNSKAGLDVNLRIIVSTENNGNGHAYLTNMTNAFAEYNYYEYGNFFKARIVKNSGQLISDFIFRRFDERIKSILNTEELAGIFHFPLRQTETPNILWLTARQAPAPINLPNEGIFLGKNFYRGQEKDIHIKRADRRRHFYVIGKSGVGKSKLIASMAIQDVANGEGVCVIDPHGDLIEDILSRVPPERAEDVILFSPADIGRPMGLNLIEFDDRYPEQKTFVINELINIFDKLYDLKSTGGPMFEQYMRNALLLIMAHPESGATLMEVPRVLSDPEFRKMKLDHCSDITVVDFWRKQAEKAGGEAALANVVPYITSKLTQFISNDIMRPIIGQQKSSFNLRDVMDSQKILLVDLSKGKIGDMNAYLLGLILVGKILISALSRADMPDDKRKDFYLYIDEFQNFTTDSISTILSEARKYGLNLIIAHQYLGQLGKDGDTIKSAVFGNVGSWITFKIGSEDAEVLEKEYSPVFNQYDLINIEAYTAYVKLLVDNTATRPFSMRCIWPPTQATLRPEIVEKIKTLSRLKYGQDRALIEAEINKRLTLF